MSMKKFRMPLSCPSVRAPISALTVVIAAALTACGQKAASAADFIGIDAAKEAALSAADITADQAAFLSAGLDSRNETFYYQIVFQGNGMEYEYDIDALTGVVIEENRTRIPGDTGQAAGAAVQNGAYGSQVPANGSAAGIDADTAFSIALSHAGLTEADVMFRKVEEDIEDGRRVFEVEFVSSDGTEYDYELDAGDGTVLSYDFDAEFQFQNPPAAGDGIISEDQAKQAVLDRVPGASAENVLIHLEEDDGRMVYEGKLFYDNLEYEFKIDAYSGGLMEWEVD